MTQPTRTATVAGMDTSVPTAAQPTRPTRRSHARRAVGAWAGLGLSLACAVALPWAHRLADLEPLAAMLGVFLAGAAGFVLAVSADRVWLALVCAVATVGLVPAMFVAVVIIGGP